MKHYPRFLHYGEIETKAIAFLRLRNPKGNIPVDIESIVEFDLGMEIIPIKDLMNDHAIDGFSSIHEKIIYVDDHQMMNLPNRHRFTLGHEMGHFELHEDKISPDVQNIADWKRFVLESDHGYEWQANSFAGLILMPSEPLSKSFQAAKQKAQKVFDIAGFTLPGDDQLAGFVAKDISREFDVSEEAAEIRVKCWLRN